MALRTYGVRLGMVLGLALFSVSGLAWGQSQDPLDQLRELMPPDSALAFGNRTDEGQALVLQDVVIDLIWRSSQIRAENLSLTQSTGPDGVTIDLDGLVLRNASGALAADHLLLDNNAIDVLRVWAQTEAPIEDVEVQPSETADETSVDMPPGEMSAVNLTIRAASQPPSQGWFFGELGVTGMTPHSVDTIEADNVVVYAMGRLQASHLALSGLDVGWLSNISGWRDIVEGRVPPNGLSLEVDDFASLDQSGQRFFVADRLLASMQGRPAPDENDDNVAESNSDEDAVDDLRVGQLEIDLAVEAFSLPVETLQPLLNPEDVAGILPEVLAGTLHFAASVDGPAQELTITTGLIDLDDIVYVNGSLALSDVSFAPDAPRMPLALIRLPGSIPMFSIAGAHLEAEDRGVIGKLRLNEIPLPSASVEGLSTQLADRLPMLAGRLDGVLAWLRGFESGEPATVRLEPATPAPAVELLSLMLINPDGMIDRLGLTD